MGDFCFKERGFEGPNRANGSIGTSSSVFFFDTVKGKRLSLV